jgi:hypothetical protein
MSAVPPIASKFYAPQRKDTKCQDRTHALQQTTRLLHHPSAMARMLGGMVRPSALAVCKFDDKIKPGRLNDRQGIGLLAFENAVDVDALLAIYRKFNHLVYRN